MGKQSSRLIYREKDHKDIYFKGKYHWAMYKGSKLVWEKLAGDEYFVTSCGSSKGGTRTLVVDIPNKDYFEVLPRHEGIVLYNNLDFCFGLGNYNGKEHVFATIDGLHYKLGDEFQRENLSVIDSSFYGFTKDSFYYIVQKKDNHGDVHSSITQFYIDDDLIVKKGNEMQLEGGARQNITSVNSDILILRIENFGNQNNGNFTITYLKDKNWGTVTSAIPYMYGFSGQLFCINNLLYGVEVSRYYVPNTSEGMEYWLSIKLCDIEAGTAGAYKCINLTGKGVSQSVRRVLYIREFFYVYYSILLNYGSSDTEEYCAKISRSGNVINNKKIEYQVKVKSKYGEEIEIFMRDFTQKSAFPSTTMYRGELYFDGASYFKNGVQMEKGGIILVNSNYFVYIDNMFLEDSENNFFVNVED